jgi:hypothetical protein
MSQKISHLEMIQGVINRMAQNSFNMKGWTVAITAGLFVVSGKNANQKFCYVAILAIFAFAIMDAYYLMQERLYRDLYDRVCKKKKSEIDFSMKASSGFDIYAYLSALFSINEFFYVAFIVGYLICLCK